MDTRITATELARTLSDVLSRIRYRGERFLVERNGEPVATTGPIGPVAAVTLREIVAQLGDLPLPEEGFAGDLDAVQSSQPRASAPEWPS